MHQRILVGGILDICCWLVGFKSYAKVDALFIVDCLWSVTSLMYKCQLVGNLNLKKKTIVR